MLEAKDPVHYPGIAMARFGQIPQHFGGGNRYRVIWAPSRMTILTGNPPKVLPEYGPGGGLSVKYLPFRMTPDHRLGEVWILEVWIDPTTYHPRGAEDWNADPDKLLMGPYPAKGVYCLSSHFPDVPTETSVQLLIERREDGFKRYSLSENAVANRERVAKEALARRTKVEDMIRDRLLIGGGEAYAARGGGRGTKTISGPGVTAQDTGLPLYSGQTTAMRTRRKVYKVPLRSEDEVLGAYL